MRVMSSCCNLQTHASSSDTPTDMITITAQTSHFYTQTIDFSSTTYLRSNETFFLIVAEKRLNLILTFYLFLFDLKGEFGKSVTTQRILGKKNSQVAAPEVI